MSLRTPTKGNKAAGVQYLEACIQNAALFEKRAPDAGIREMAAQIHAILNKHLGKDHARKTRRPEPEPANPHSPMKYYQLSFEGHQLNRSPRLWKFLVELPESTKGASDEFKATSAARKAGGAELRTDFQIPMMEAKLVPTDAAKPDSAKPVEVR
jgi:hypothetical protein